MGERMYVYKICKEILHTFLLTLIYSSFNTKFSNFAIIYLNLK